MNSTPSKDNVPSDGPTGRADEQLAHAHEQIVQADEQLTRLSEQLAKLERDDVRPPPAEPGPQPPPSQSSATPTARDTVPARKAGARGSRGPVLAAGIAVVALVWQSSYGGGVRPSPQLASAPSLPPENPSPRNPLRLPFSWPRLRLCRRKWLHHQHRRQRSLRRPHRRKKPDRRRPHRRHRIKRSCCRRWRATWRIWSAPSNSSGEPATDGKRQCKGHRGAEGEPGRDEACARQGSRSDAAQAPHHAAGAACSGLAQAGRTAAAASESAAEISISAGMALRRLVAAER